MIVDEYKLLEGIAAGKKMKIRAENISNLELATLFLLRTADLYLKDKGIIGFVLPRSLFTADQHNAFRLQQYPMKLGFREIWDLEKVKPLFNVPTCVFIAEKGINTASPYKTEFISGNLERKNAGLIEAEKLLKVNKGNLYLSTKGQRSFLSKSEKRYLKEDRSYYHRFIKRGADIIPRSFWFIDIKTYSKFGFNPSTPYVETSEAAQRTSKENYKGIFFKGNIEKNFLYATLLSTDIVPFGHLPFRLVVLPLIQEDEGYSIIKEAQASEKGFIHLSKWLRKAQDKWEARRGEKAEKIDIVDWLNYRNKLTEQKKTKYKVLYPTSATYLCGCVVEKKAIGVEIEGQMFELQGFVAESKEYYFETDKRSEAYYLCSILNSPTIDELIKPMQSRGLFGPRDIHKKVWELPIPKFDSTNEDHRALAKLGEECTKKVSKMLSKGVRSKSIGHIRKLIKEELREELIKIDKIIKIVLKKNMSY
jgi:hypothetical protein